MKSFKLLQLLLLSCVFWSCSNETIDSPIEDPNAGLSMDQYDNSYLGLYRGLFTTNDGLKRGSVEIILLPNHTGQAKISLQTGEQISLFSNTPILTLDDKINNLGFSTESSSSLQLNFEFSVSGDGQNPEVSNVNFESRESNILIAKNTQRLPLTPITGTYVCTNCSANGVGFPSQNRTWNVMSIGTGNNQNFMAQVFYGGRIYNSPASNNVQTNCSESGGFTTCDVNGSIRILGHDVIWGGVHTYSTTSNQTACSSMSGTWSAPTYGGAAGTFVSDSDCSSSSVANDICANAIEIAIGDSITGTTVNATMSDAPASCVIDYNIAPGVWYTFVGDGFPATINTLGSSLNTKVGLFSGTCAALICINGDETGGPGNTSLIPLDTVLDKVYYIYVSGTDTNTDDFILNIVGPDSFTSAACDQSIQDHAGNGSYGGNRTDVYVIDAGDGNIANLYFPEFDTEEGYDFVRIYDGPNTASPVITTSVEGTPADAAGFSGTGVTGVNSLFQENIMSTGRYLTIVFTSDPNVAGTGFTADITCMVGRQSVGLQQTSRTFKPAKRIMPKK